MYSLVLAAMLTAGSTTPSWCHGCHGCYSCHGCYGCYSCGCYGCYGCYGGGCYGGYYGGCYGCYGGCYGCYGGGYGYRGYASYGYGGVVVASNPVAVDPGISVARSAVTDKATVVVQVPADAVLYVDGTRSKQTAATRTIVTPQLPPGENYSYTLKVEATRDGQVVTESKRIVFQAGRTVQVDFGDLSTAKAKKPIDANKVSQLGK